MNLDIINKNQREILINMYTVTFNLKGTQLKTIIEAFKRSLHEDIQDYYTSLNENVHIFCLQHFYRYFFIGIDIFDFKREEICKIKINTFNISGIKRLARNYLRTLVQILEEISTSNEFDLEII